MLTAADRGLNSLIGQYHLFSESVREELNDTVLDNDTCCASGAASLAAVRRG